MFFVTLVGERYQIIFIPLWQSFTKTHPHKMKTVNANTEVREYENSVLVELLKEIKKIGNSDKPAMVRKSKTMSHLFKLEKSDYNFWADQYYAVSRTIESEILHRVVTDKW